MNPTVKKFLPAVIVGALLLLGALAIYAILVGPSKEPYRTAQSQYQNVYNANVAFSNSGASLNASNATDEQFEANVKTIEAALASLKTENEALAKAEVLQNSEGKELYEAFSKKLSEYMTYNSNVISSISVVRPVIYTCTQKMSNLEESARGAQEIRACAVSMGEIKDIPDADYAQMIVSFEEIYNDIAQNIDQVATLADPNGTDKVKHASLQEVREDLLKKLNETSTTLSKNLQVQRAKVDITESAMALDKYLSAKSSIF